MIRMSWVRISWGLLLNVDVHDVFSIYLLVYHGDPAIYLLNVDVHDVFSIDLLVYHGDPAIYRIY